MTNPHPRGSRAATIWETGYNAGRWTPDAPCPYKQPWCVAVWQAGRAEAWQDYNRTAIEARERFIRDRDAGRVE